MIKDIKSSAENQTDIINLKKKVNITWKVMLILDCPNSIFCIEKAKEFVEEEVKINNKIQGENYTFKPNGKLGLLIST